MAANDKAFGEYLLWSADFTPTVTYNDPLLLSGFWHLTGNAGATKGANVTNVWEEFRGT